MLNADLNRLAEAVKKAKQNKLLLAKKPTTSHAYIGVEIEFYSKQREEALMTALIEADVDQYCELSDDMSICPEDEDSENAFELKVLCKQTEYVQVLSKVLRVIRAGGGAVNDTCGLHVHLDMRRRNADKAFHNLAAMQNLLYRMCPAKRLSGDVCYAKPVISTILSEQSNKAFSEGVDRYYGVNACALKRYHTLEVRIMHGCLQTRSVINWVKLLLLAVRAKPFKHEINTVTDLVQEVNTEIAMQRHILRQVELHAEEHAGGDLEYSLSLKEAA